MEIEKTVTTIFMVPTLKIKKGVLGENGFINGFSKDAMREVQYEDCIYLLFRPSEVDRFRDFLEGEYERTKAVIDDYDYPDGFVVVVYKLEAKYKNDFVLVRLGKYSKTSPQFQSEFPKVVQLKDKRGGERDEISLQYRVFNKTEDLVTFWEKEFDVILSEEQELWYGFDEENETLTEETLKNITEKSLQETPKV